MIYHIWKKNEEYDPNYQEKIKNQEESVGLILEDQTIEKDSLNLVEAMPDKQFVIENKSLSISFTNLQNKSEAVTVF